MTTYLDFEKPIAELEAKIGELRGLADEDGVNIADEVETLEAKAQTLLEDTYRALTPWQKTLVARHPERPHFSDFAAALVEDFTPLAGDRVYGEDKAVIGGLGRFRGQSIAVIGTEKGSDTESRLKHNFGYARPEGYRKAVRIMDLAQRFRLPVVTLIDTPAAYPGIGAEERGQAEAIARSIEASLKLDVPLVAAVIGEGGSGGAVALACGNHVMMLEHATYSVIPPEACSSILWRSTDKAEEAAGAMKLTAQSLYELGIIDEIVPEPMGGAQRGPKETVLAVGDRIEAVLRTYAGMAGEALRAQRRKKFLDIGRAGLA